MSQKSKQNKKRKSATLNKLESMLMSVPSLNIDDEAKVSLATSIKEQIEHRIEIERKEAEEADRLFDSRGMLSVLYRLNTICQTAKVEEQHQDSLKDLCENIDFEIRRIKQIK